MTVFEAVHLFAEVALEANSGALASLLIEDIDSLREAVEDDNTPWIIDCMLNLGTDLDRVQRDENALGCPTEGQERTVTDLLAFAIQDMRAALE